MGVYNKKNCNEKGVNKGIHIYTEVVKRSALSELEIFGNKKARSAEAGRAKAKSLSSKGNPNRRGRSRVGYANC